MAGAVSVRILRPTRRAGGRLARWVGDSRLARRPHRQR